MTLSPSATHTSSAGEAASLGRPRGSILRVIHREEAIVAPLSAESTRRWRVVRLIGTMAALLIAVGGWGGGAVMAQNPISTVPVLNVLARAPFAAVGLCLIGTTVLVVSWLTMMRYALPIRHYHRGETDITQMTRGQSWTVLAGWSIPLFFTAPMFSKDVYSYVAFGYAAHQGLDVYAGGPQDLLHGGPLVDNVPLEWRHTPAQYGAGLIAIARLIGALTGENIVAAIVCYRVLALISLVVLAIAVRWLAHRCNMRAATALWLGVLNPLTLFHMVAGIHNEGIMLALTMVGLAIGLEGTRFPRRSVRGWGFLLLGACLIALGASIKLPAMVALGFLGMEAARRWWKRWWAIPLMGIVMVAIMAVTVVLTTVLGGTSWAWITTTGAAAQYPTVLTLTNDAAKAATAVGSLLGLGNHYEALRGLFIVIGVLIATAFLCWALWKVYLGELHPVGGFGMSMFVIVLCFPVMHPWYLLWGVVALSAWINDRRYRIPVVVISAIVSIWIMPQGGTMPLSLNVALVIETLVLLVAGLFTWRMLFNRDNAVRHNRLSAMNEN